MITGEPKHLNKVSQFNNAKRTDFHFQTSRWFHTETLRPTKARRKAVLPVPRGPITLQRNTDRCDCRFSRSTSFSGVTAHVDKHNHQISTQCSNAQRYHPAGLISLAASLQLKRCLTSTTGQTFPSIKYKRVSDKPTESKGLAYM